MAAPSHFGVHFEYSDLCDRLKKLVPERDCRLAVIPKLKLRKGQPKFRGNFSMSVIHPYKPPAPAIKFKRSLPIIRIHGEHEVPEATVVKPYRLRRCGSVYSSLDC
jgi:hypothetical protein